MRKNINPTPLPPSNLELSNGNRYGLFVRVADADADALDTNPLGLFLSVTVKLHKRISRCIYNRFGYTNLNSRRARLVIDNLNVLQCSTCTLALHTK